jgi:hypothetical protein
MGTTDNRLVLKIFFGQIWPFGLGTAAELHIALIHLNNKFEWYEVLALAECFPELRRSFAPECFALLLILSP